MKLAKPAAKEEDRPSTTNTIPNPNPSTATAQPTPTLGQATSRSTKDDKDKVKEKEREKKSSLLTLEPLPALSLTSPRAKLSAGFEDSVSNSFGDDGGVVDKLGGSAADVEDLDLSGIVRNPHDEEEILLDSSLQRSLLDIVIL